DVTREGRTFSAGFAPLVDQEDRRLGMFAVATDKSLAVQAQERAWRSLAVGAAAAALAALLLAGLLSRTFTRPLQRLHEGARAVARGELETELRRETGDEIGDLAEAFAGMTRAVRENQERLAA